MTRHYSGPVPHIPMQYKRSRDAEAIIAVGALLVVVGAIAIIGVAVIL